MTAERTAGFGSICLVAAAALLWSSSYSVTKEVLHELDPLTIGAARFSMAALALAAWMWCRRRQRTPVPTKRVLWLTRLSGLIGITAYFVAENYGVELSNAADASLIVATYPLMTMIVEMTVKRRMRMSPLRVGGVVLAGVGAVLVVRNGAEAGGDGRWLGDTLLLTGGLVWAVYSVLSERVAEVQGTLAMTARQTYAGAFGFIVLTAFVHPAPHAPSGVDALLLLYLAIACSVGGFLFYNHGLRGMPSSVAVNILNLVPVFGVLGAVVVNHEQIHPAQILGGAVIVTGVVLGLTERRGSSAAGELSRRSTRRLATGRGVPWRRQPGYHSQ